MLSITLTADPCDLFVEQFRARYPEAEDGIIAAFVLGWIAGRGEADVLAADAFDGTLALRAHPDFALALDRIEAHAMH